jgi:ribosomal protein S18 acetylase RimI-like enzyme
MYKLVHNVPAAIFLEEGKDIIQRHWDELENNKDKIQLNPDVKQYELLQNNNILHNLVAYKHDKMIGYSVIYIHPHVHCAGSVYASVDVIYVVPECRNTRIGAKLLLATEKLCKDKKVDVILYGAKPNAPMIINPLKKLGYNLYEYIYGKYIGD